MDQQADVWMPLVTMGLIVVMRGVYGERRWDDSVQQYQALMQDWSSPWSKAVTFDVSKGFSADIFLGDDRLTSIFSDILAAHQKSRHLNVFILLPTVNGTFVGAFASNLKVALRLACQTAVITAVITAEAMTVVSHSADIYDAEERWFTLADEITPRAVIQFVATEPDDLHLSTERRAQLRCLYTSLLREQNGEDDTADEAFRFQ